MIPRTGAGTSSRSPRRAEDALADVHTVLAGVERDLFADLDDAELAQFRSLLARVRTRPGEPPCV
ncbi:MAG TPA: hypothetical protein VHV74_00495 [Pseudonocardiaceae bacterium]|nr:hypothetical protein [Pseudonocardiaceae bacterium]